MEPVIMPGKILNISINLNTEIAVAKAIIDLTRHPIKFSRLAFDLMTKVNIRKKESNITAFMISLKTVRYSLLDKRKETTKIRARTSNK
jgi:hypothetical protein